MKILPQKLSKMRALAFIVLFGLAALMNSSPIKHSITSNDVATASFDVPDGQISRNEVSTFWHIIKDVLYEKIFESKPNSANKSTGVVYSTIGITLVVSSFLEHFY